MRFSIPILSSIFLSSLVFTKNIDSTGFQHLKFDITRGDSFQSSSSSSTPNLIKRTNPDGTIVTTINNLSSFYSITLKIGSEQEEVTILVDTGSSDLWVSSVDNPYCATTGFSPSSSSSSSSSSSKKYRNLNDADAVIDILGKEKYRKILDSKDELDNIIQKASSKYRNINDNDALNSINFDSQQIQDETNLLATASINNKAVVSASSDSSIATIDCANYGTFDSSKSTTFKSNNTDFFIMYGDATYAAGEWGYDNVNVGGIEVDNFSFAVANQSNSSVGVLGIGLEGLETTYAGSLAGTNPYTYANLPTKLVQDGLINTRAYSLWLNSWEESSGNILFGGVDHAKYEGDLGLVPIINTLASSGYQNPIKLQVTLSSISYTSDSKTSSLVSDKLPALLDSGTTLSYLPSDAISSIADAVGAQYSSSYGYYLLDCPSSSSDFNITFNFQGVDINVPLTDIVLTADSTGSTCVLALMSIDSSEGVILGDSFLRSAYVVYDLDNLQIGLAQSKNTSDEDIEVISDSIPSASSAANYANTYGVSGSDSTSTSDSQETDLYQAPGAVTVSGSSGSARRTTTTVSGNARTTSTGASASSRGSSSASSGSASSTSTDSKNSSDGVSIVQSPSKRFVGIVIAAVLGLTVVVI